MSWKASAWAKDQRLGSPSAKSILMCLADYADPDGRIKGWASQSDLAEAAEVSERTAREWLQRLEEWGLLSRERQQRPSGARAADWIVLHLDRCVCDGADRLRAVKDGGDLPANSAGRSYRQPDARPTGNEAQPTGTEFRAYKEEPPISDHYPPSEREARASEREEGEPEGQEPETEGEDAKRVEAEGWALLKDWPGFAGMPKEPAMRIWRTLTAEERAEAKRKFKPWLALLKAQKKSHVPAPSTYFGQRLFREVPEPQEERPAALEAAPFGKLWQAARIKRLVLGPAATWRPSLTMFQRRMVDAGQADEAQLMREQQAKLGWPEINRMHELASYGKGAVVAPDLEGLAEMMEAVRVGSALWEEWRSEHQRRGWPWMPDPGKQEWVYLPRGGPAGLVEFEAAVRGEIQSEAAE
ncbi:helix-turn-helix domain-containing protein [Chelativorans oligotrophicus]|uniref:helix-turn-helix domain-containing protein n=1 Tax=Chelativorans oligotrophicus TaxID=449974 RepID=UPI001407B5AB|nr:helix-turn-helix domain-containing protein [Chelativorans oligotrophicus]